MKEQQTLAFCIYCNQSETTVQFLDGLHSWVHKLENVAINAVHASNKGSVIMAANLTLCIFVSKVARCVCNYFILSSEQHCSGLAGIFLIAVCVTTEIKQDRPPPHWQRTYVMYVFNCCWGIWFTWSRLKPVKFDSPLLPIFGIPGLKETWCKICNLLAPSTTSPVAMSLHG